MRYRSIKPHGIFNLVDLLAGSAELQKIPTTDEQRSNKQPEKYSEQ